MLNAFVRFFLLVYITGPILTFKKLVELGCDMFQRVSGPHVTFIDPRNHDDTRAMMKDAYNLYKLFRFQGVPKENIIISVCIIIILFHQNLNHFYTQIPATEAGILAAQQLQKNRVNVNLYLVSSLLHAAACAETSPAVISIPVSNVSCVFFFSLFFFL